MTIEKSIQSMPMEQFRIYRATDGAGARMWSRKMFPDFRGFDFLASEKTWLQSNSVHLHGMRVATVGSSGHRIRLNDELNDGILVPLRGNIEVERKFGRSTAKPGEILITTAGERCTSVGKDYLGVVVLFPREMLARRNNRGEPDAASALLDLGDVVCAKGEFGNALRRQILFLVEELDQSEALHRSERLKQAMFNTIADLLIEFRSESAVQSGRVAPVRLAAERQVRAAEEFIRANIGRSISIGDVAASVGVSMRSLQGAFRLHRGSSPKSFLTARRLEHVRQRLLSAGSNDTVTSIMYDCGASNPGRFAGEYRSIYGESPSETLAASRRKNFWELPGQQKVGLAFAANG